LRGVSRADCHRYHAVRGSAVGGKGIEAIKAEPLAEQKGIVSWSGIVIDCPGFLPAACPTL
jgi:hypothetical protein